MWDPGSLTSEPVVGIWCFWDLSISFSCTLLKINFYSSIVALGFPGVSVVKNPPVNAGFDSRVRKIPGEGNGNPLYYSGLENPMYRGA